MDEDFSRAVIKSGGGSVSSYNKVTIIHNLKIAVGQLGSTSDTVTHPSPIECQKLAAHAAAVFDKIEVDAASYTSLDAIDHLQRIERAVDELMEELSTQSKLKKILGREDVTNRIDKVYQRLSEAVQIFDLGTHSDLDRIQQEREQARRSDMEHFGTTLRSLNQNVCKISEFLGVDKVHMPEDVVPLQKAVNRKSRSIRPTDKAITECGLDDATWALAEGCWSHEPLARPTADSVTSHLHSIRLTSLCAEPVSSTDDSSYTQNASTSSRRETDLVFTDQDLIIAIMGPTGSGKSSFINSATQQELAVVEDHLESCTQDVRAIRYHHPGVTGLDIVFVDTPGFDDTTRSDYDVLKSIAEWLKKTYEEDIKLSGILYFHSIADIRMRGSSLRNLEMFKELCGEEALQNVVFTTSMWDGVTEATGRAREAELRKNFWKPFIARGCRMARFCHTYESAWDIMKMFKNPRPRVLLVQKEMVDEGKPLSETSAYQAVIRWWNRMTRKFRGRRRSQRKSTQYAS